ncbi:nematocyst expressed protein 3-like isoform X1 [Alexandromys fortis]|uniref:nematocyst expressed protein 3-like isoform X1 n=1 Tax=Alexandromys fortis TaxID=100897 RepID=UPI002152A1A1|nr:nematocyst expressed protein 3-like isoform X1 [Microtus fortis]
MRPRACAPQPRRCTVPAPACTQGLHQARTLLWSRPSPEGAQFPLLPAPRVCTRQGLCCGAAPAPKVHSSCSCLHPGSAPGKDSAVEPPQPRRCTVPAPACTQGLHQARTLLWSRPSPEGAQFLLLPAPRVCTRQGLCCGAAPAPKVHSSRSCLHPGSAPGKDSAVEPPQPRRCTVPAPACTQGLHQARTLLWSRPSPEGAQFLLLPAPRVCTRQGLCCGAAPALKVHSSRSCLHPWQRSHCSHLLTCGDHTTSKAASPVNRWSPICSGGSENVKPSSIPSSRSPALALFSAQEFPIYLIFLKEEL